MNFKVYGIQVPPKPRQTRSDKWKKRPCVERYRSFCDRLRLLGATVPDSNGWAIFVMGMPSSWSKKKKDLMRHKPHQQKADLDNMAKSLFDALYKEDSHIWDGRFSKVWGDAGKLIIITGVDTGWIETFLDEVL